MIKKRTICLAAFIMLAIPGAVLPFSLHIDGEVMSLSAEQIPLQRILREMSHRFGIQIRIDPRLNPGISASFSRRALQKGLEGILRPYAHAFIWENVDGPFGPLPRLVEIHVFLPGKREKIRILTGASDFRLVVDPNNGARFVENVLLIRLRPGMTEEVFEKLLMNIGGTLDGAIPGIGVYRIRIQKDANFSKALDQLNKHPGIARVEPDFVHILHPPARSGESRDSNRPIHEPVGFPGVSVAVLDSGVEEIDGFDMPVVAELDGLNPGGRIMDSSGHGTQMALIASGAVKPYGVSDASAEINPVIPIRVFDRNGVTSNFTIMEAVGFALENGARVMSLSWGSETHSRFLEDALNMTRSKGVFIFASAGNRPTGRPVFPAAYPAVIGVGALNSEGQRWENSNFGDFVSVYAPGIANLPVGFNGNPGVYAGTSISAAYTAHRAAAYLADHPEASLLEILRYLK